MVIDVRATGNDGMLTLIVSDDGPGLPPSRGEQTGIGLPNTRHRLKRLYEDGASLVVENAVPRGVRVTITLPLRQGRGEDGECN